MVDTSYKQKYAPWALLQSFHTHPSIQKDLKTLSLKLTMTAPFTPDTLMKISLYKEAYPPHSYGLNNTTDVLL